MAIRRVGIFLDLIGGYGRDVYRGIGRYRRLAQNWQVMTPPLHPHWEPLGWAQWNVDGYVAQVAYPGDLEDLLRRGLPVVNVSGMLPITTLPTVRPDDVAAGRLAAEHLLDCGFRNFGYLGWRGAGFSGLRASGFCTRIAQAGFACDACEIDPQGPAEERIRWLQSLPKPAGILVFNDAYAAGILRTCQDIGIAVPEQLAVMGVDDDELFYDVGGLSLTSVSLPAERVGYAAAALLDRLLEGGAAPEQPILIPPGQVMARQSTDILAIEDPDVASAVRFIREHACEAIGVEDVISAVPVGRRSLERHFHAVLGRTLLEEITRVRIERVRQLLVETDLQMSEIARRSGFTDATYMATAFRNKFAVAPRTYRVQSCAENGRRRNPAQQSGPQ